MIQGYNAKVEAAADKCLKMPHEFEVEDLFGDLEIVEDSEEEEEESVEVPPRRGPFPLDVSPLKDLLPGAKKEPR